MHLPEVRDLLERVQFSLVLVPSKLTTNWGRGEFAVKIEKTHDPVRIIHAQGKTKFM